MPQPHPRRFTAAAVLALATAAVGTATAPHLWSADANPSPLATEGTAATCPTPGRWIDPASGEPVPVASLIRDIAQRAVVLLGENHANAEHHRWQLHTLAALHGHRPGLAVGFEMFPRAKQPVLDAWAAGELDETAFLEGVDWRRVWGFDPVFYLPLFHFVRQQRLPMVALNVERSLVSQVGREGLDAIPATALEGVSRPAPASTAYRRELALSYGAHGHHGSNPPSATTDPAADPLAALASDGGFQRFVEAQLLWDRAMAEALAAARQDGRLAVGIMGAGHVAHGFGVAHQLRDLGVEEVVTLLPMTSTEACQYRAGVADAVFVVPDPSESPTPPRPLLGVRVDAFDGGVRVVQVGRDSIAAGAGLRTDDVITRAGGRPLGVPGELIDLIRSTPWGAWLPLTVTRGEETLELVAKFPPRATP
ncbi:MAG: ChaN family lipoprotein [Candidatus Competibacterales bacterium]